MANEAVMYMRGPFPFYDGPRVSTEMVRDAKHLLTLNQDQLIAIRQGLGQHLGFLDRSKLEAFLATLTGDKSFALGISKLVTAFRERSALNERTAESVAEQLEEWLTVSGEENERDQVLSRDELTELKDRLPFVLAPYPCFERQSKAERLSSITGQELERIDLICDLRPVFDKEHQNIEGMIPYTLLKVVCTGADGIPIAFEAMLSEKAVDRLVDEAKKAKAKLGKLREYLGRQQTAIPVTDLTAQETENAHP
ncbi:MAG: hypothetical protein IAG10_14935 [Planctomycetaceae bacterium]|nr:hypothetical protein [Planctomycetaceae bacterium]